MRHVLQIVAGLAALLAAAAPAGAARFELPAGPGVNLVYARCQTCHDLQYVVDGKGLLPAQWDAVVSSMKDYGLTVTPDEQKQIAQYLGTYLGPHPPPAAPAAAAADDATATVSGRDAFAGNCSACHGAQGQGTPGTYPPLAGNPDLTKDPAFPVLVVLNGLNGPIEVDGASYHGTMPPFGHLADADIAAIVNYVRGTLAGAKTPEPVTAQDVAAQRARGLTPQQVIEVRAQMR